MRGSSIKPLDKFMVETYKLLMKHWREVAEEVADVCLELCEECKVYVIGSVARGTATALSDLDVLAVVPENCEPRSLKKKLLKRVIWRIPYDYPLNLHVIEKGKEGKWLRRGFVEIR